MPCHSRIELPLFQWYHLRSLTNVLHQRTLHPFGIVSSATNKLDYDLLADSSHLDLNLDDAEPGWEDLEDIAGGQLYRLRRGGSGLSNGGRGGYSAGRGRGGASNRGGHASVGGRGNFAPRGRNLDHSRSGYVYTSVAAANIKLSILS